MTCLWAKYRKPGKGGAIPSSDCHKRARILGRKLGIEFKEDIVEYNLKVIDKLAPESTASMQKDMAKGHQSEVQGLLFDMITAAEEQGIEVLTYRMVAEKFK